MLKQRHNRIKSSKFTSTTSKSPFATKRTTPTTKNTKSQSTVPKTTTKTTTTTAKKKAKSDSTANLTITSSSSPQSVNTTTQSAQNSQNGSKSNQNTENSSKNSQNNQNIQTPPPTSYFQRFQRLDTSATQIDIDSSFNSSLSYETDAIATAAAAGFKDPLSLQAKAIKLGKHKTKQRLDNTQHISKSLSLAMKTGRLPTLIQQVESPLDFSNFTENNSNLYTKNGDFDDDIPFIPGQMPRPKAPAPLPSETLMGGLNDVNMDELYDMKWNDAYNSLVSTGLDDLSIKATNATIKRGDYVMDSGDPYSRDTYENKGMGSKSLMNEGDSKLTRISGFQSNSIYTTSPSNILPKDTDIAAAATAANWFPGHMKKALEDMADKIKHVPLSIEVRDARLPLSSANPLLDSLTINKTKIIVLNKTDLVKKADESLKLLAESHGLNFRNISLDKTIHPLIMQTKPKQTQSEFDKMVNSHNNTEKSPVDTWINSILYTNPDISSLPSALIDAPHIISPDRRLAIIVTNNNSLDTTKSLLTLIKALAPKRKFESIPTSAIICGYPNVGKSTIINNLKISARMTLGRDGLEQGKWSLGSVANTVSKARAKIGPLPGVTRQVQGFKVSNNPPIVILDSPGIMVPRFDRSAAGINTSYKLALIQCISDVIADPKIQCEHLLQILNQNNSNNSKNSISGGNNKTKDNHHYTRYYETPLFTPITNLQILSHFILKKEEIELQSIQQWRESAMKTQFGKILSMGDYHKLIYRARMRERELDIHMGAVLNRYEEIKKVKVNMKDFSNQYLFPSLDELSFEISPELEELAIRSLLKSFRAGKLGKIIME